MPLAVAGGQGRLAPKNGVRTSINTVHGAVYGYGYLLRQLDLPLAGRQKEWARTEWIPDIVDEWLHWAWLLADN